ncbi:hypothetical protein NDU88_009907 [Pleurodeles waltl]|uniref:Uncharacterized protein n=1 Tax=Pleurodeles waltl TaxID=8319 RepID=A0AAV7RZQ5_PLEWA|nr:hypothetical protein NDU88_009907 [Pleurodeles waltl]
MSSAPGVPRRALALVVGARDWGLRRHLSRRGPSAEAAWPAAETCAVSVSTARTEAQARSDESDVGDWGLQAPSLEAAGGRQRLMFVRAGAVKLWCSASVAFLDLRPVQPTHFTLHGWDLRCSA